MSDTALRIFPDALPTPTFTHTHTHTLTRILSSFYLFELQPTGGLMGFKVKRLQNFLRVSCCNPVAQSPLSARGESFFCANFFVRAQDFARAQTQWLV